VRIKVGQHSINPKVKYLTLDILKPHYPDIVDLSRMIMERVEGIHKIKTEITEIDQDTESIRMEVYGGNIDIDRLKKAIRELGASLHSIDEVVVEY